MNTPAPLLANIRVVELGTMVFAPSACAALADFGADVIKIEPPGMGDLNRHYHKIPGMPVSDLPYTFQADNRTKKSIALDVKSDAGYEVVCKLVSSADVFVTNYRPSAVCRLKLTYDDLKPIKPDLVYAFGSGYGEEGPECDKPGYDSVSYWSRSALETHLFPSDGWLQTFPYGSGDHPSGMALFGAVMLGLYHRQRTGCGCKVSTSLLANGAYANSTLLQAQMAGAAFAERRPRSNAYNFSYLHYRMGDGRILRLTLLNAERDWPSFCKAISRPELIEHPRFAKLSERVHHMEELIRLVDEAFAEHDAEYWRRRLDEFDVAHSVMPTFPEAADDPQMAANDIVVPLEHPRHGSIKTVSSPVSVEGFKKQPATAAPELGENTAEVLRDLGYSKDDIDRLIATGVAQQHSPAAT